MLTLKENPTKSDLGLLKLHILAYKREILDNLRNQYAWEVESKLLEANIRLVIIAKLIQNELTVSQFSKRYNILPEKFIPVFLYESDMLAVLDNSFRLHLINACNTNLRTILTITEREIITKKYPTHKVTSRMQRVIPTETAIENMV